jgi:hypothetical protein
VAELRPLPAGDNVVATLVADGRVRPPARPGAVPPRPRRVRLARSASALLDELRGDAI